MGLDAPTRRLNKHVARLRITALVGNTVVTELQLNFVSLLDSEAGVIADMLEQNHTISMLGLEVIAQRRRYNTMLSSPDLR
jgi:hypothetical protein